MEHINRIEIQGKVGTIRINNVFDQPVANMSVATEHIYKNREGYVISEITWHNVVVWGEKTTADLTKVEKGTNVRVVGRLRQTKYTDAKGNEKVYYEVIASEFSIVAE